MKQKSIFRLLFIGSTLETHKSNILLMMEKRITKVNSTINGSLLIDTGCVFLSWLFPFLTS